MFTLFKTSPQNHYAYETNKNRIIKISKDDFENLSLESNNEIYQQTLEKYNIRGFLIKPDIKKIEHPHMEIIEVNLQNFISRMTLQITQKCNLMCSYCPYADNNIYKDYRGHSNKSMDFITAKKSVDFLIKHSTLSSSVHIGFYGGEPLLEKDLLFQIIDYALEKIKTKPLSFGFTTNATLLDDYTARKLNKYNMFIQISLDGPKDVHNKNRYFKSGEGSFDIVIKNIKNIQEKYKNLYNKIGFNTVLSPDNDTEPIYDFFNNNNITPMSKTSFNTISETSLSDSFDLKYSNEYLAATGFLSFKTYLSVMGKLDKRYMKSYSSSLSIGYKLYQNFKSINETNNIDHPSGPCIPGIKQLFIDVNGNFFPCEKTTENFDIIGIGNLENGFNVRQIDNVFNIGRITKEECKKCWAFHLCFQCASNLETNNNTFCKKAKLSYCKKVKRIVIDNLLNYCFIKEKDYDIFERMEANEKTGNIPI